MHRRRFLKGVGIAGLGTTLGPARFVGSQAVLAAGTDDRAYWVSAMVRIGGPVLENLAAGRLKERMPVEHHPKSDDRPNYTYLEALGRTLTGMAPWLEVQGLTGEEAKLQERYRTLALQGIGKAVDPSSPDYMNFSRGGQPLVDAAFLAHALLRAPEQLLGKLDAGTRAHLIDAFKATRVITPGYSNWLLFSSMVEMALMKLGQQWDGMRVDLSLRALDDWYKGDGVYGDGPEFHWDYYNSFVIQPFMLDILAQMAPRNDRYRKMYERQKEISARYAAIQERLISPEGTYPIIGRSIAYRFGAFQLLSQVALQKLLPADLQPAQVRSALTAVIRRIMEAKGVFDEKGWLRIGVYGSQPSLGETYISTGSLYLCSAVFVALGLPPTDPFWAAPGADWTSRRVLNGEDLPADHAL